MRSRDGQPAVMKSISNVRAVLTVIVAVVALFFLENNRRSHLNMLNLHHNKAAASVPGSANDFIFFESLSKYLFISFSN